MLTGLTTWLQRLTAILLWPFDQLPPTLGLGLLGALCGVGMLAVVGRTTPQQRLRVARDRMSAAIYELRLFIDSPRRILGAQGRLLVWSGLYLLYLTPAFLVLLLPLAVLLPALEARYGLQGFSPAASVLMRIELDQARVAAMDSSERAELAPVAGVSLTASPVLVRGEHSLYLRLAVRTPGRQAVVVRAPQFTVTKNVSAYDSRVIDAERLTGLAALLTVGSEAPLPLDGPVRSVTLGHAARDQRWLGMPLPWWGFWLLTATASALALRRRLGVTL